MKKNSGFGTGMMFGAALTAFCVGMAYAVSIVWGIM